MIGIKDISLQRALNAAACRELPHAVTVEDTMKEYWTRAIAFVKKRDQSCSYCLVERGSDGVIHYKADYGSMSGIYGLISVHPYVVVDVERFGYAGGMDKFKAFMKKKLSLSAEDIALNTEEDWRKAYIEYAIRQQDESDAKFQQTGIMEIDEPDDQEKEAVAASISFDNLEGMTVISSDKGHKRGRKPKK